MDKSTTLVDHLRLRFKKRDRINDELEAREIEIASTAAAIMLTNGSCPPGGPPLHVQIEEELRPLLMDLAVVNRQISAWRAAMHIEGAIREFNPEDTKTRTRAKRKTEASSEQIEDQEWNEAHPKDGTWTGCLCHAPHDEDLSCEVLPGQADLFSDHD